MTRSLSETEMFRTTPVTETYAPPGYPYPKFDFFV